MRAATRERMISIMAGGYPPAPCKKRKERGTHDQVSLTRRLSLRLEWANGPLNTRSLRYAVAGASAPVGMTVGGLWSRKKRGSTSLRVALRGIRQIKVKGGGRECPPYIFSLLGSHPSLQLAPGNSHLADGIREIPHSAELRRVSG